MRAQRLKQHKGLPSFPETENTVNPIARGNVRAQMGGGASKPTAPVSTESKAPEKP